MVSQRYQAAPTKKTSGTGNPGTSVTIHETANLGKGAGAATHANLQSRGNVRNASWHWSVDDKEAVQSFRHDIQCWHAGTTKGNNTSIAIEICVNSDSDYNVAVENAAQIAAQILKEKGLGVGSLVQHNHWSGKNCPTFLRSGSRGPTWDGFVARVNQILSGSAPTPPKPTPPKPTPPPAPRLVVDGQWGGDTTFWMQVAAGTPRDRVISHQWKSKSNEHIYAAQFDKTQTGSTLGRWIQTRLHDLGRYSGKIDGLLGDASIRGLQGHYGTPVDGIISPTSTVVRAIQTEINAGSFLGVRV